MYIRRQLYGKCVDNKMPICAYTRNRFSCPLRAKKCLHIRKTRSLDIVPTIRFVRNIVKHIYYSIFDIVKISKSAILQKKKKQTESLRKTHRTISSLLFKTLQPLVAAPRCFSHRGQSRLNNFYIVDENKMLQSRVLWIRIPECVNMK